MLSLRLLSFLLIVFSFSLKAEIVLHDSSGRQIRTEASAKRIVSLAPHITELLFVAGASNQVVGVVDYSDYPKQARSIQRIGSYNKFDMESIVALKPDLIIAWSSGNPESQVKQLIDLGYRVLFNEPRALQDIQYSLIQFGQILGTENIAQSSADDYMKSLNRLRSQYKDRNKVRVFYQVWKQPLFTVNGEHIISRVIELCGGINVFSDLNTLAPNVDIESVIRANPDIIIAGMDDSRQDWLDFWRQWTSINAVKNSHLYPIDADLIVRHTPRILQGIEQMCQHLDRARHH